MRNYLLTFIAVVTAVIIQAQPGTYSRVEVPIQENTIKNMAELGLPMDAGYLADKSTFIGEFSQRNLQKLDQAGIDYEILIEDVSEFYVERNKEVTREQIQQKAREMDVPVPEGFNLGSMGGFLTYDELLAELDTMAADYPDLITERDTMPGGTSIEGRPLYYTKISDNPGESEDEPQIFFTGMHHAREPGGMMVLVFYMYHLLENYDTDAEIQNLVNNTEIYIAPCVNPDGYIYNEENDPNGGGMWRKNRRDIEGSAAVGVDLNRNYGYMWGYDDSGSSPNPWDQTYRGDSAFSEPETQIIKQFCENHEFGFAINYHTYSDLLLYTWGYTEEPCEDDELLAAYSEKMTQVNNYEYGPGSTTIYPTNGGSDDWMYGEQETKNKIMSFTPEVGGDSEGFWPSSDQIIPQCQENLLMNILATKFTGNYVAVYDRTPTIVEEETGYFHFDVRRLGLEEGDTYTVSIEPLSDNIASVGEPVEYSGLELMETLSDSISYTLADGLISGDSIKYALTIDNGDYAESDTLTKLYGEPVTIISDSCNTISGWETEDWDITGEAYFSEPHSITDSPDGNYDNYTNSSITLDEQIDLSEVIYAQFSFRAKWDIESGYDYVQTQVSTDEGESWTPLSGQYTSAGTYNQEEGEPLYDGTQNDWVLEEINLNEFIGEQILIRYILVSDQGVTEDGFYFDDVEVKVLPQMSTGNTLNATTASGDITVFPNPAGKMFTVKVNGAKTPQNMQLFNSIGSRIKQSPFNGRKQQVDLSNLEAGLYYVKVTYQDDSQSKLKKVVVY
ncbi:MAG: immune inhibitor A [Bacteroidales bacterium]|nr:immune inhibitor A [Bacteroidales bacterium]